MLFKIRGNWFQDIKVILLLLLGLVYCYFSDNIFMDGGIQFIFYSFILSLFLEYSKKWHFILFVLIYTILFIEYKYYEYIYILPYSIVIKLLNDMSKSLFQKELVLMFGQYFVGSFASNKVKISYLDVIFTLLTFGYFWVNLACLKIVGSDNFSLLRHAKFLFEC